MTVLLRATDFGSRPWSTRLSIALATCSGILALLAPTPSRASAATTDCFALPSSCGYPDATNTGPTGTLTASGSITASTAGEIIENRDITGSITVNADNVTIKNDRITLTDTGSGSCGICAGNATGTKVINTLIRGNGSGASTVEAAVRDYGSVTVEGSAATNCNECVQGGNVTLKDSSLIVSSIYSGAHAEDIYICSDSVNVSGSTLINEQDQTATVFGDTICGGGNNFQVTDSLLAGGGYTFYPQGNSQSSIGTMTITGNRFARCKSSPVEDSSGGDWLCNNGADGFGLFPYGGSYGLADSYYSGTGNVWENNVWDDNSQPVCADGSAGCGTAPPPTPAEANWTAPSGAEAGVPVTLDGSASTGEAPIACKWTIETSAGSVLATKSGCKVTYTFASPGTQYVKLAVTGANGQSDSNRQSFSVASATTPPPTPAEANWTAPSGAEAGVPVTLDGSASTGEAPIACKWTIETSAGSVLATKSGCKVTYTFASPGTQYVKLAVTGANGQSDSNRQSFSVASATTPPPTPAEANWTAPSGAEAGVPVTLDGSASTGEAPIACKWTIETSAGSVLATKSGCKVTYTFASPGIQYVKLAVTGANGQSDSNRQSFSVASATTPAPLPDAALPSPTPLAVSAEVPDHAFWRPASQPRTGEKITLDGTASQGDPPLTCVWTLRGRHRTRAARRKWGCTINLRFRQPGVRYIRLTVHDGSGSSASLARTINVLGSAVDRGSSGQIGRHRGAHGRGGQTAARA